MNCTAAWNLRWFNKPKFHLLLHLLDHIPLFGPAILCATEAFESFNAIIRTWSIHSNRQAPSRDIGRAAARCNRVRHIVSGGYIPAISLDAGEVPTAFSEASHSNPPPTTWRQAGPGPASLVHSRLGDTIISKKLGLTQRSKPMPCKSVVFTIPLQRVEYNWRFLFQIVLQIP
jgi:hypothetical protein